jgi:hypothetical protein
MTITRITDLPLPAFRLRRSTPMGCVHRKVDAGGTCTGCGYSAARIAADIEDALTRWGDLTERYWPANLAECIWDAASQERAHHNARD